MTTKQHVMTERLIDYWKGIRTDTACLLSPSVRVIVDSTIGALERLKETEEEPG